MPRGFELKSLRARLREPRVYLRLLLSVLLAANLGAALLAMRPPGGSAADLALREQQLHAQLAE
ncbi:MAG: hypothetical protein FJW37_13520, partial [Acidobacteria bacterium]|nr:hypothetical protein [Acidobacteriota bacterium]